MPEGVDHVEIKFEQLSNLIIIPIKINNKLTLKFVLDTGAESAILTEKVFGDVLGLNYVREIVMQGPGMIDSLQAYVASGVAMELPGGIKGAGFNMLVLKEDYIELNKNLGEEVYGIIGYDVFQRFVINIDYDHNLLNIYDPHHFKPKKWETSMDISLESTKPYLTLKVRQRDQEDSVKLMVDSGASHALLLDVSSSEKIVMPDSVINTMLGQGLGGEIPGYMGRMDQCFISQFTFHDVLVSIPLKGIYMKAIKRGSRHGTIGGDVLSRFRVTFDYCHQKIYLSKGRTYKHSFETNMSGMLLETIGDNLDILVVARIIPGTPAHKVGIEPGDQILRINHLDIKNNSISEINALMRHHDGMRMRVLIYRDGEKIKKKFRLTRMI